MKDKFGHLVQYHFGNLPAYSALTLIVRDEIESYYIVLSNQGNKDMNSLFSGQHHTRIQCIDL